jgi:UDP-N-acetyl-D-mannosaminuronate dehydrogenase
MALNKNSGLRRRTIVAEDTTIVVGLGEVGRPLYQILRQTYDCIGVDIEPASVNEPCSVLHLCIPYQIAEFVATASEYIARYQPRLTVINSTVAPGTTTAVAARSRSRVVYSPVRGKHARMQSDMLRYRKFVGADDARTGDEAIAHFSRAGFKTERFSSSAAGELAKLLETTWLGVLVGWAQEAQRIALKYDSSYDEINAFIKEIDFLPHHITPGIIGGHCVMPNIEILRSQYRSAFLEAIVESNYREAEVVQVPVQVEVNS